MLGVVGLQLPTRGVDLLQFGQGVALCLDAGQHCAGQVAGHAVGLHKDKGALNAHGNSITKGNKDNQV